MGDEVGTQGLVPTRQAPLQHTTLLSFFTLFFKTYFIPMDALPTCVSSAHRGQKRKFQEDPLELESQAIGVNHLVSAGNRTRVPCKTSKRS